MRTDSEIEQQVLRSFALALAMASREIAVESHDGVVTLRGTAQNRADRSVIYSAACLAAGVCRVVSKIGIKKRAEPSRNDLTIAPIPKTMVLASRSAS